MLNSHYGKSSFLMKKDTGLRAQGTGHRAQGGRTACGERLAAKAQGTGGRGQVLRSCGLAVLQSCGLF